MRSSKVLLCCCLVGVIAAIATHKKEASDRFDGGKDSGKRGAIAARCFEDGSDVVSDAFGNVTEVIDHSLADSDADGRELPLSSELRSGSWGRGGSLWRGLPPVYKTGNDAAISHNKGDLS